MSVSNFSPKLRYSREYLPVVGDVAVVISREELCKVLFKVGVHRGWGGGGGAVAVPGPAPWAFSAAGGPSNVTDCPCSCRLFVQVDSEGECIVADTNRSWPLK